MAREKEYLTGNLLEMWNLYAESYRNAVSTYNVLLEQKVLRNMKPLKKVKTSVIKDWKEVEFFNIRSEEEVIEFLEGKDEKEMRFLEKELKKTLESYEYKAVTSAIKAFKNEIYRFDTCEAKKKALKGKKSVMY